MASSPRALPVLLLLVSAAMTFGGCRQVGSRRTETVALAGDATICFDDYYGPSPQGTVLVLVPGWACDARVWDAQVEALAPERRVLAVDLPGHGRSAAGSGEVSMAFYADAIAAAMDEAGAQRAILVGHSNGTPVVRQFLRRHRQRTAGLVVVEGALRSFFPSPEAGEAFARRMQGPQRDAFLESMIESVLPIAAGDEKRAMIREMMRSAPEEVQVASFRATLPPELWEPDPIEVPLLVVLAEAPFWTDEYEAFVRGLAEDVEYHKLTGVSHFVMIDEPEKFNAILLDWMRRHE